MILSLMSVWANSRQGDSENVGLTKASSSDPILDALDLDNTVLDANVDTHFSFEEELEGDEDDYLVEDVIRGLET